MNRLVRGLISFRPAGRVVVGALAAADQGVLVKAGK